VVPDPPRPLEPRRPGRAVRPLDGAPCAALAAETSLMSRFRNRVDAQQAHILSLRVAVGLLAVLCLGLWFGWQAAPRNLTVHVPPDLRTGSTRLWWDIPPENIYAFALYIFGQLNRWPANGEQDYPAAIQALRAYLTPACLAFL